MTHESSASKLSQSTYISYSKHKQSHISRRVHMHVNGALWHMITQCSVENLKFKLWDIYIAKLGDMCLDDLHFAIKTN